MVVLVGGNVKQTNLHLKIIFISTTIGYKREKWNGSQMCPSTQGRWVVRRCSQKLAFRIPLHKFMSDSTSDIKLM